MNNTPRSFVALKKKIPTAGFEAAIPGLANLLQM